MISPSSAKCHTAPGLSDVLLGVPFAFLLIFLDPLYFSPVPAHTSSNQQLHVPLALQGKKIGNIFLKALFFLHYEISLTHMKPLIL